jgi:hypothetical protein
MKSKKLEVSSIIVFVVMVTINCQSDITLSGSFNNYNHALIPKSYSDHARNTFLAAVSLRTVVTFVTVIDS